jgi:hypothetical protein
MEMSSVARSLAVLSLADTGHLAIFPADGAESVLYEMATGPMAFRGRVYERRARKTNTLRSDSL